MIVNDLNRQVESLVSENERLVGRLDDASYERAETIEKHGSQVKSLEVIICFFFFFFPPFFFLFLLSFFFG